MMKFDELFETTKQLLQMNESALEQLEKVKGENDYEVDFYQVVKPFSDEVKAVADKWKELSLDWIGKERPKYIYPIQIESTYENLGIISVQAFYQDTKMKRFKDMHQSIHYVLNSIVEQLNED